MGRLSIGDAWTDTSLLLRREGKLMLPIALLLMGLPNAAFQLFVPTEIVVAALRAHQFPPILALGLPISLFAIVGALALTAMALIPRISVGEALATAGRRFVVVFAARLLLVAGMLAVATASVALFLFNPAIAALALGTLFCAIVYVGVRLLLLEPAVLVEPVGPIAAIERSWRLSAGHFWRLLGFLVLFVVGAAVLSIVAGIAGGACSVLFGKALGLPAIGDLIMALFSALASALVSMVFAVMIASIYRQLGQHDVGGVFS